MTPINAENAVNSINAAHIHIHSRARLIYAYAISRAIHAALDACLCLSKVSSRKLVVRLQISLLLKNKPVLLYANKPMCNYTQPHALVGIQNSLQALIFADKHIKSILCTLNRYVALDFSCFAFAIFRRTQVFMIWTHISLWVHGPLGVWVTRFLLCKCSCKANINLHLWSIENV